MKKINNKGFTLVELLATIAIMGLIATMTTVNIAKIFKDKNRIAQDTKNSIIESTACVFIELKENENLKKECKEKGCLISTDTLIKKGLLQESDVDNLKFINIYYENNEKKCTLKEVE